MDKDKEKFFKFLFDKMTDGQVALLIFIGEVSICIADRDVKRLKQLAGLIDTWMSKRIKEEK